MGVVLKNGNWFIDYRLSNGKRRREKIGSSKKLAENALRKRKLAIAEGKFLDVKREKKIKFEIFAEEFLEIHCKPNHKNYKNWATSNINILKRNFSGKYLHEITPLVVEEYKSKRVQEVSAASVNRSLTTLKSLFNRAIDWGKFDGENPVRKVKFFKEENHRLRYLEKEEIVKLLSVCRGYLKPIVIVALNTGMRRGEILPLKWSDIDFKRGIIHLLNTKNSDARQIPMNELLKTTLIRVRKHPESPYVFHKKDGSQIGDIKKSFHTALNRAGIKKGRKDGGVVFHTLRHSFASHLVMSGVDLNTVRELMGHKSLDMTIRYAHLSRDHKKRAVDTLGKRMEAVWSSDTKHEIKKAPEMALSSL